MELLILRLHYQGPMILSKISPHRASSINQPMAAIDGMRGVCD